MGRAGVLLLGLLAGLQAQAGVRYCDYPVYPPVSWSDGRNIRGLAPEVARALAAELGQPLQMVNLGNWKRCLLDASSGRVDLLLAYRSGEREAGLIFSETPVLREEVALFYNRERPLRFRRLGDLRGYRGGLLFGESYGADFDRFAASQPAIEYVSGNRQNFGKLIRGRIDYIPHERRTGNLLAERLPGGEVLVAAAQPITVDYLRVAVSRRSPLRAAMPRIEQALQRWQADGSLQRWLEQSEQDYRREGVEAVQP